MVNLLAVDGAMQPESPVFSVTSIDPWWAGKLKCALGFIFGIAA